MLMKHFAEQALLKAGIKRLPITSSDIEAYMQSKGWDIVSYDAEHLSEDVLIKRSGTTKIAKSRPCFTYQKDDFNCVFYNERLSEREKILAFAHELGHMEIGHVAPSNGVLGYTANGLLDEPQEVEANEFALYFLAPSCILHKAKITSKNSIGKYTALSDGMRERVYANIRKHGIYTPEERLLLKQFKPFLSYQNRSFYKKLAPLFIGFSLLIGLLGFIYNIHTNSNNLQPNPSSSQSNSYDGKTPSESVDMPLIPNNALDPAPEATASEPDAPEPAAPEREEAVIVTPSGKRYHRPNCQHVKNRTSVISITIQQALESGYTPCQTCLPDED